MLGRAGRGVDVAVLCVVPFSVFRFFVFPFRRFSLADQ